MDIYDAISRNPRIPEKIDLLKERGLIKVKSTRGVRNSLIELTDKGISFADTLDSLSDILEGER